jgi:hypothetical protein
MEEIAAVSPKQLIVTDPPNSYSVAAVYERHKTRLLQDFPIPPIVVMAYRRSALILDGNCRSYLLAHLNRPIRALVLTRDSDRDIILELQAHRDIPPFPHHEYLAEKMELNQLRSQAIVFAKLYGFLTVQRLLEIDIDTIEPVPSPTFSKAAKIRAPTQEVLGPKPVAKQVKCLVLYDRQGKHFLPILPTRLEKARGTGYDWVTVTDLPVIQEGIAWARKHWNGLDPKVHGLLAFGNLPDKPDDRRGGL